MIALTEIISASLGYDPAIEHVKEGFSLRNTFVNPSYVISFRESESLTKKSKKRTLVEGMSADVSFTQLTLMSSGHGVTKIDVVGTVEQIAEKFRVG